MLITVDPILRDDLDIGPKRGASDWRVGDVITWLHRGRYVARRCFGGATFWVGEVCDPSWKFTC
jgi:hypothetical protein